MKKMFNFYLFCFLALFVAELSAQSYFTWTQTGSLNDPRYLHGAASSLGKIYVTGGSNNISMRNSLEIYNPSTGQWTYGASMQTRRYNFAWIQVGDSGKLYAFGGEGPNGGIWANQIECYNPVTNTWKNKRPWTQPRESVAFGVINGEVYLAGGRISYGASMSRVEKYNPILDTMITVAPLQQHRRAAVGAVVNNKFYVIGGNIRYSEPVDSITNVVEMFNPTTNTWQYKTPMPLKLATLRCVVKDDSIFVFGNLPGTNLLTHALCYSTFYDTWAVISTAQQLYGSCALAVLGDSLYSIGGYNISTTNGYGTTYVSLFLNYSIIPVELNEINISSVSNTVNITWRTATETNNKGFSIYRDENFVSFISGNGTTTEEKSYSFSEANVPSGKHHYKVTQHDYDGTSKKIANLEVFVGGIADSYDLLQNYPNPFNPSTTIRYAILEPVKVTIRVYDLLGNEVAMLLRKEQEAGYHEVEFNAALLASGTYIYQIVAGDFVQSKKMILIK